MAWKFGIRRCFIWLLESFEFEFDGARWGRGFPSKKGSIGYGWDGGCDVGYSAEEARKAAGFYGFWWCIGGGGLAGAPAVAASGAGAASSDDAGATPDDSSFSEGCVSFWDCLSGFIHGTCILFRVFGFWVWTAQNFWKFEGFWFEFFLWMLLLFLCPTPAMTLIWFFILNFVDQLQLFISYLLDVCVVWVLSRLSNHITIFYLPSRH